MHSAETCDAERLQDYGAHAVSIERDQTHEVFYFTVAVNKDAEVTELLAKLLREQKRSVASEHEPEGAAPGDASSSVPRVLRTLRTYPLMPQEVMHNLHDASPGTADFFSVDGAAAPFGYLRERCAAILNANPWLAARLRSQPRPSIVVPEVLTAADHEAFFSTTSASALGHESLKSLFTAAAAPGRPLSLLLAPLFSRKGIHCIDRDAPLFKVRAVAAADGKGFLLTTSMSHVLGDGATMYNVHAMLHPNSRIVAMNPERVLSMPGGVEGIIPGSSYFPAASLAVPPFVLSPATHHKWQALHAMGAFRPIAEGGSSGPFPPTMGECNVYLDEQAVNDAKQAAITQGGAAFVSTNDVFTAWLFRAHKAALGLMAYNARPLLRAVEDASLRVGNYQVCLAFGPSEFASPAGVRQVIQRAAESAPSVVRGADAAAAGDAPGAGKRIVGVTSWTQAHRQLELDGATHLLHQPLTPFELLTSSSRPHASVVLYKPVGNRVAALLWSQSFTEDVQGAAILGDPVLEKIDASSQRDSFSV